MRVRQNRNAKVFGYFSHHIRGIKGDDATPAEREANCAICREVAHKIMDDFPEIDLYVPADHEEFPSLAMDLGYMDEAGAILAVDCAIIGQRDFVIAHYKDNFVSNGMQVEIDYAVDNRTPLFPFINYNRIVKERLEKFLTNLGAYE